MPEAQIGKKLGPKKGRFKPKGRQIDLAAVEQMRNLLGNTPPPRDHLIEAVTQNK
jgi:hypothetical protein